MPNELQFLRADNFRQMAPPILRLEVDRLGRLIEALAADLEARNALVRARFALARFIDDLDGGAPGEAAAAQLEAALMNLALPDARLEAGQRDVLRYVADRIRTVHDRLPLLY